MYCLLMDMSMDLMNKDAVGLPEIIRTVDVGLEIALTIPLCSFILFFFLMQTDDKLREINTRQNVEELML